MPDVLDASKCPLCGKSNRCAMELERQTGVAQGPCWCVGVNFSAELLAAVPKATQGLSCICAACAAEGVANLPKQALSG